MKRLLITSPASSLSIAWLRGLGVLLGWGCIGAALIALAYQLPARHVVNVGYNDAGYVQGFSAPVNRWGVIDQDSQATTPLRYAGSQSAIIFPQIGLPATATLRWRALPLPDGRLPTVRVLLNGRDELGSFRATGAWETHSFAINTGLLKANDLFLELRTEPTAEIDGVARGVQVDRASLATVGWPILPYPAQLVYGAAAAGLGAIVVARRSRVWLAVGIMLAFVLLYRLPLMFYPWRALLPALALLFGAIAGVRAVPRRQPVATLPALAGLLVVCVFIGWLVLTARDHVVLSIPGVERDFPVFATRAANLTCPSFENRAAAPCVLRADGFYQLGYPFLLWALSAVARVNAFVAGQIVAGGSGLVMLAATWVLGSRLYHGAGALLALLALALSPFFVQYSLYLGTDMPFAALWVAGLAALLYPLQPRPGWMLLAGGLCGWAFIVRHPGLVLLPFGWIALIVLHGRQWRLRQPLQGVPWRMLGWFTAGWAIAAAPQIAINILDTGTPLYSQQAKNLWLAVYGNIDYSRWSEASNDVRLTDLVLADPPRFAGNWIGNIRAFLGTGAEDRSEFGQAIALRLLHFPTNILAIAGLGLWAWRGDQRRRLLLASALLYVLGVTVGFALPRFFLPLAPIWALASAEALLACAAMLARKYPRFTCGQWLAIGSIVVLVFIAGGPQLGAQQVLAQQNADAVAVVQMLQQRGARGDQVAWFLPNDDPLGAASALTSTRQTPVEAARFLIWSAQRGERPAVGGDRSAQAIFGPYSIFEMR